MKRFLILSLFFLSVLSPDLIAKGRMKERQDTISPSIVYGIKERTLLMGHSYIPGKLFQARAVMTTPDLIKTLQTLPGVAPGTEMTSGLYVRGGTGADNLYLMDNVPLYQSGHFYGLYSAFNTDVISHVDFYKGPFPAKYSGKISSVVDVSLADGDTTRTRGSFSVGITEGRVQVEGPMKKKGSSFNVAARIGWIEALLRPAINLYTLDDSYYVNDYTRDGNYAFGDFNGKFTWHPTASDKVSASFYVGHDMLILKEVRPDKKSSNWGNVLASAAWTHSPSDESGFELVTYVSDGYCVLSDTEKYVSPKSSYVRTETNRSNLTNVGARMDAFRKYGWNNLGFGGSFHSLISRPYSIVKTKKKPAGGKAEVTATYHDDNRFSLSADVYCEDEMKPAEWFTGKVGLNLNFHAVPHKIYPSVEPRVSAAFRAGDVFSFNLAYSRMSQGEHLVSSSIIDMPGNYWMPVTAKRKPLTSDIFTAEIAFGGRSTCKFSVAGYYKWMRGIYEYFGSPRFIPPVDAWNNSFEEGRGRSYGLESYFELAIPRLDLSASYTLSWTERYFEAFWRDWFPDRFDNRHKFNLNLVWHMHALIDFYANWTYRTGNRFTLQTHYPDYGTFSSTGLNNFQMPDYHRLDIGFDFNAVTLRKGRHYCVGLGVYNLYGRKNPVYAEITTDVYNRPQLVYTSLYPIIPMLRYSMYF